jgi:hypothetical protein
LDVSIGNFGPATLAEFLLTLMRSIFIPCFSGFNATGSITILGGAPVSYTYNVTAGNANGRTLQYFSTTAETKMRHNYVGAYFQDFQKFYDYYGATDYSDQYVEAAFRGKTLTMNGKTFDFSGFDLGAKGGKYS